jgi:hypothetical protein
MGNYGQRAHIVAFREEGPRGRESERPEDIDSLENLLLHCPECHKEIDDHPVDFPRAHLEKMKAEHETRIDTVTGLAPESKSHVADIPQSQMRSRIFPYRIP